MKVLLIAPNPRTESGGIAQWTGHIMQYYGQLSDPNVELIHCCYEKSVTTFGSDSVFTRLRKAVTNYVPICRMMRKALKGSEIDIVHICTSASLSLFLNLYMISLSHHYNAKVVLHYRFGRIPDLMERTGWESKILKKVLISADMNIVIDKRSFESLQSHGFKKLKLLPNPLSPKILELAYGCRLPRISNKILFVGHVIFTKGVEELIKACKEIPNIQLELIGYVSDEMRRYLTEIAGANSERWLTITGIKNMEYIIASMKSAGVFVLPTYSEGFPNVILEGMACACPIVTTPVGAIPEMLEINGVEKCGLCVEPKSYLSLKEGIENMLNNKEFAINCGRNAQKRVIEKYSIDNIWESMVEIWEVTVKYSNRC